MVGAAKRGERSAKRAGAESDAQRIGLRATERWWEQLEGSARVRWEWIDPGRAEKARQWFFRWRDKDFSFTDCSSFVVMKQLRIREALTNDRHFIQAGFQAFPTR